MTARRWVPAAVAALGPPLVVATMVAGLPGLVAVVDVVAVLAVLMVRLTLPTAPAPPRRPGPPERLDPSSDFPDFRRISSALSWSGQSARLYDRATRPTLITVTAAVLRGRRNLDADRDPSRARRLLGPDLWTLVDPARPASDDGNAPAPSPASLERLTRTLEDL